MATADKRIVIVNAILDAITITYIVLLKRFNSILNAISRNSDSYFDRVIQATQMMSTENAWLFFGAGLTIFALNCFVVYYFSKHYEEYDPIILLLCFFVILILLVIFWIAFNNPLFRAAAIVIGASAVAAFFYK